MIFPLDITQMLIFLHDFLHLKFWSLSMINFYKYRSLFPFPLSLVPILGIALKSRETWISFMPKFLEPLFCKSRAFHLFPHFPLPLAPCHYSPYWALTYNLEKKWTFFMFFISKVLEPLQDYSLWIQRPFPLVPCP